MLLQAISKKKISSMVLHWRRSKFLGPSVSAGCCTNHAVPRQEASNSARDGGGVQALEKRVLCSAKDNQWPTLQGHCMTLKRNMPKSKRNSVGDHSQVRSVHDYTFGKHGHSEVGPQDPGGSRKPLCQCSLRLQRIGLVLQKYDLLARYVQDKRLYTSLTY